LQRAAQEKEKTGEVDFGKDVFSVMAGRATELEWFMFETRIRQLVQEIVEPVQDRTNSYNDAVTVAKQDMQILRRRIEEVEFVMQKVQRQSS